MKIRKVTYTGAVRVWTDATALRHLREMVLWRDHRCVACGRTPADVKRDKGKNPLTTAHYHARHWLGTRYCFFCSCILCMSCHTGFFGWEHDKQGIHRRWMIQKYGESFLELLYTKARRQPLKKRDQIIIFMEQYKEWKATGVIRDEYLGLMFSQGMTTAIRPELPREPAEPSVGALDG